MEVIQAAVACGRWECLPPLLLRKLGSALQFTNDIHATIVGQRCQYATCSDCCR